MFSMLSWIPVVGPIIDGIVSIFKQKTNTDLAKQVDKNKTEVEKLKSENATDLAVIQTRSSLLIAFKDDPGIRIARDLFMWPFVGWVFVKVNYLTFHNQLPGLVWDPLPIPEEIKYMPYGIFAFLFATAWRR